MQFFIFCLFSMAPTIDVISFLLSANLLCKQFTASRHGLCLNTHCDDSHTADEEVEVLRAHTALPRSCG